HADQRVAPFGGAIGPLTARRDHDEPHLESVAIHSRVSGRPNAGNVVFGSKPVISTTLPFSTFITVRTTALNVASPGGRVYITKAGWRLAAVAIARSSWPTIVPNPTPIAVVTASRPSNQAAIGGITMRTSSRNKLAIAGRSARSWACIKRRSSDCSGSVVYWG